MNPLAPFAAADLLALLDQSPTATLYCRAADAVILHANTAAARLFGYPAAELCGMHRSAFVAGPGQQLEPPPDDSVFTIEGEAELRRRDGSRFNGLVAMRNFDAPDGSRWTCLTVHDNSAAHKREERLIANVEQLAFAVNQLPTVLPRLLDRGAHAGRHARRAVAVDPDQPAAAADLLFDKSPEATLFGRADGRIVSANAAACALLGYCSEEIQRLGRDDLFDGLDPQVRAWMNERTRNGFASGESRMRRKDGSHFLAQYRTVHFVGPDDSAWACTSFRDITEARRLEQGLRDSEQRYRALLAGMLEGVLMVDANGRVLSANPAACRILGRTEAELLAHGAFAQLWPLLRDDGSVFEPEQLPPQVALRSGRPVSDVIIGLRHPDARTRWLHVGANPLFGVDADTPQAVVVSFSDITEIRDSRAALAVAEERLRLAIEANGDGVWDWNVPAGTVQFSKAWKAMLGFAEDEIRDSLDEWKQRVHPDDLEQVFADVAAHFSDARSTYSNEHRVRCKDGSWKWILDRGMVVARADDGSPLRMLGTHTDVTERRLLEERLRTSDERHARVLEGSDQGFWDWNIANGEFRVSDRFETMLGFTPGERSLHPDHWPDYIHPNDLPAVQASLERHLRGETPAHEISMRCRTRAGGWRWIQTCGRIVERTADGRPLRMAGTHTDVEERKQAEVALRRSEARLRLVTTHSADMISLLDADGHYLFASAASVALLGRGAEELRQCNAFDFVHPDDLELVHKARDRLFSNPGVDVSAYRVRHRDGTYRWVESTARAVRDDHGELHEIVISTRDISEHVRVETALRELAATDALTGIANRREFMERLEHELARVRLDPQHGAALLLLDLDEFKAINDRHGHPVGDIVLERFADLLRVDLRKLDLAGRIGGDEFAVILGGVDSRAAEAFAERLRRTIAATEIVADGRVLRLTASIGLTGIGAGDLGIDDAIARADAALYRAKQGGRNRVAIGSAPEHDEIIRPQRSAALILPARRPST